MTYCLWLYSHSAGIGLKTIVSIRTKKAKSVSPVESGQWLVSVKMKCLFVVYAATARMC